MKVGKPIAQEIIYTVDIDNTDDFLTIDGLGHRDSYKGKELYDLIPEAFPNGDVRDIDYDRWFGQRVFYKVNALSDTPELHKTVAKVIRDFVKAAKKHMDKPIS